MDVAPYLELKPAPHAVFDSLEQRRGRPRFMLQDGHDSWRPVLWESFAEDVRCAASFVGGELQHGERAAIFAPNCVEWLSAALGIQAAGGAVVPVYASSTPEQAGYIVEHSDTRVLFVHDAETLRGLTREPAWLRNVRRVVVFDSISTATAFVDELEGSGTIDRADVDALRAKLLDWNDVLRIGADRNRRNPGLFERRLAEVSLDQHGMMLYTSGTSGNPKGVPLTHRNVSTNARDWLESNAPLLDEGAVDLLWLPMSHIFGFGEACLGNTLGWTSYLATPSEVLNRLPDVRPHVLMSVPSVWEKLGQTAATEPSPEARRHKLAEITGGRLRFCLSGGARLPRETKELFYDAGLLLIEGYGLTECAPTLTLNRPEAFRFDTVGKPFPSVQLHIAEDGEILAKGPNVFGGYHKDPEATRDAFTEYGWFKTGDVGRLTEDGFLQIIDRKKDILVTAGGKNVAPANIERLFDEDPLIAHAVVYGDGHRYLVAGIWLDQTAVEAALARDGGPRKTRNRTVHQWIQRRVDAVNRRLARHETIKRFVILDTPLTVEDGLLTATFKIRRKKVYEHFHDQFESLYHEAAAS